ncbi:MAG: DoxX family membrane protein [bacterium]|nr:DoxX family membrane protein [bacterium]
MNNTSKISIFLLRISLGFMLVASAVSKIANQGWTAEGYIGKAKTFSGFYHWLSLPSNVGWVNFLNEWGMLLIGLGLVFGVATRLASFFGILLMALYYFPILQFPYADKSLIVDQHIIFMLVFFLLIGFDAGRIWGLDSFLRKIIKV